MGRIALLVAGLVAAAACGGDPPPPPPFNSVACDKLDACGISSSGFSCDGKVTSACAQCINGVPCGDIVAGRCAPPCPGVTFKVQ
jgi:hypothetical protein